MKKLFLSISFCLPMITNGQWTEAGKDSFINSCKVSASSTLNPAAVSLYCDCVFTRVSSVYSTADEASRKLTPDQLKKTGDTCMKELERENTINPGYDALWTEKIKEKFLASCRNGLKGSKVNSKKYCDCVLEQMIIAFPDPMDCKNSKDADLDKIAIKCLE